MASTVNVQQNNSNASQPNGWGSRSNPICIDEPSQEGASAANLQKEGRAGADHRGNSTSRTQNQVTAGAESQRKRKAQASEEMTSTSSSSLLNNKRMKQTPLDSEAQTNTSNTSEQRSKFFSSRNTNRGSKSSQIVADEPVHEDYFAMDEEDDEEQCNCINCTITRKPETGLSGNRIFENQSNASNSNQQPTTQRKRKAPSTESTTTRRVTRRQGNTTAKNDKNPTNGSMLSTGNVSKGEPVKVEDSSHCNLGDRGDEATSSSTSRKVPSYVSRRTNPI
mmetsp:Transcript_31811/g.101517  ORF Transcript_31811/g.101517 Transcript_31811/m.101517 type:complete len:279 (+) Transcript_31811:1-837(+)